MKTIISAIAIIMVLSGFAAWAVDGIAISYHSSETDLSGLHTGYVVRHVIRSSSVTQSSTIYSADDARCVRLSPNGDRIAFVRTTDGVMCTAGIDGSQADSICVVGPGASIDWIDEEFVYFIDMYNFFRVNRLSVLYPEDRDILGYFEAGVVSLSVATDADSFRGMAVLDFGAGEYVANTIDYRMFIINVHPACQGYMSSSGNYYALGTCEDDLNGYHRGLKVMSWKGDSVGYIKAPSGEYLNRGTWAVNTDDWFAATVGKERELLSYHDMALIAKNNTKIIRITKNTPGSYDEACDFWQGNPDEAIAAAGKRKNDFISDINTSVIQNASRNRDPAVYSLTGRRIQGALHGKTSATRSGVYFYHTNTGETKRTVILPY